MPIYDNNGTTNFEIKKVFDNDGTTSHQISKAYDYNGTTNSLIYSAEEQLYPGTTVITRTTNGATAGTFYANNNNTSGGSAAAYIPIPLTGFKTCKITVSSWACNIYAQIFIGISNNFTGDILPQYMNRQATVIYYSTPSALQSGGNKTYTLDISALTGTSYIGVVAYSGSSVSANASGYITSIILE